jgi:hypothetical protein
MKTGRKLLCVSFIAMLIAATATAQTEFEVSWDCPEQAVSGTTPSITVTISNPQCNPPVGRVMTAIGGNSDQTAGGFGIFGPIVSDGAPIVPAATDLLPGICDKANSECLGALDFTYCETDAECVCREVTPGVADIIINTPPVPSLLEDTVAGFILFTEWEDGDEEQHTVNHCLVEIIGP